MSYDFSLSTDNAAPQVSIGLPVFNGEATLRCAIDSLLSQTFTNIELIISDNASTDTTAQICQEYAARDRRVRYIRQPYNLGAFSNFRYVLHQAGGDHFMWAAADNYWHPEFIEKNHKILLNKPAVVSSISKAKMGKLSKRFPKGVGTYPIGGDYSNRVYTYLSLPGANARFYGLFRRQPITSAFIDQVFYASDMAVITNSLKWGEFFEVDEILLDLGAYGETSKLIIDQVKNLTPRWPRTLCPFFDFTQWLWANLDRPIFWKCVFPIFKLNIHMELLVLAELLAIKGARKW